MPYSTKMVLVFFLTSIGAGLVYYFTEKYYKTPEYDEKISQL